MKLNELKLKRNELSKELKGYNDVKEITDEVRSRVDAIATEIEVLDKDIKRMEIVEKANIVEVERANQVEERQTVTLAESFRDFLRDAVEGKGPMEFRADPLLSSTDTGVINKIASPDGISVLTSPAEQFLRSLGITFYENINGNLTLSSMAEDTGAVAAEDVSAASADMTPASVTLAAVRYTHSQAITREMLSQSNPQVYQTVLQNLVDGLWRGVRDVMFDNVDTDAATQIMGVTGTVDFQDILNQEASVGYFDLASPAFVTQPQTKAYLKQLATISSISGPAWVGNEMNGYPAFASPGANTERIYFGDWSKVAIATFGDGIQVIVDPYTQAKQGRINLTAVLLADSAVFNKRGFCIIGDASTY